MDVGDYAIPLLMALAILLQVVSGYAIKPQRFRFQLISRRRNRLFYRFLIHMWIGANSYLYIGDVLVKRILNFEFRWWHHGRCRSR